MYKKGFVVWLTGLPASGKTTISNELNKIYVENGLYTETLDGDEVRRNLSPDLGFNKKDRELHAFRIVYVSKLLARNGVAVNVAIISPYRKIREYARSQIETFIEVFVKTPLEVCIERDPKGFYKKALNGEINDFTGIQDPYEEPINPEVVVDTTKITPCECAQIIWNYLKIKII